MELREAINKIVNQFGKKIISEQRFIYMLADYYSFRDNPAEKHVLSAIVNDGYATELLRNDLGSELVNKMRCDICRCYGYRDDLVKDVLESLLKGLMISFLPESNNMDSSYFMGNSVVTNFKSNDIQFFLKRTMVFRGKEYVLCDAYGYYNDSEGSFVIKGGSLLAIQDFYIHLVLGSEIVIENQEIKYNRENNKNKKRFKKIDISKFKNLNKPSQNKLLRDQTLMNKCRLYEPHFYYLEADMKCSSPSEAAFMVTGSSSNGMSSWKDKNGRSLKDCIKK